MTDRPSTEFVVYTPRYSDTLVPVCRLPVVLYIIILYEIPNIQKRRNPV